MKRLVIIGANEYQNKLVLRAREMGIETHVFAWAEGAVAANNADYFYPISIIDKESILDRCKLIKPDGICSIASDLANVTVAYIAEKLGLPGNSTEAVFLSTNKHAMRRCFEYNNIPSPISTEVTAEDDLNEILSIKSLRYPLIVKPTDRSGSRGVSKVNNIEELRIALEYALDVSFEKRAVVEEFVEGKEYSMEYISYKGKHEFLAITEKFTTGDPHYIEYGHVQPADIDSKRLECAKALADKALTALGITNGASHPEIKIESDGNIKFIEIGSRMGGDCIGSDLVLRSTGKDFVKMVIDVSLGNQPEMDLVSDTSYCGIRFIMSDKDREYLESIPEEFIVDSFINPAFNGHAADSSSRGGYYIIADKSRPGLFKKMFGDVEDA